LKTAKAFVNLYNHKPKHFVTNIRKPKYCSMLKKVKFRNPVLIALLAVTAGCGRIQQAEAQQPPVSRTSDPLFVRKVVVSTDETSRMQFVNNQALYTEHWDSLAQPRFWKQIMGLSPDSCIVNVAKSRTPLTVACYRDWCAQTEAQKSVFKNQLRNQNGLEGGDELFVTNGKREFYEHRKSLPVIAKAVEYFKEYNVDPWYAQTILLIESPGKQATKSYVGANGPFQLMKSVAVKYGLKVNNYVDERADLKRAAYGASRLISTICIPKVKALLEEQNIAYKETDLWFRLLVMHAYHAGGGNLACAMHKLRPTEGGQQLIRDLWHTSAGGFQNESQNYSQIALAALWNFEEILRADGDTVFMVQGDRYYAKIQRNQVKGIDDETALRNCLRKYERDMVDGTISFAYFLDRTQDLRTELVAIKGQALTQENLRIIYPETDHHYLLLARELMMKRKSDEAIQLLRYNLESFPESAQTAETLSKVYRATGEMGLSQKYMAKSNELSNGRSR